MKERGTIIIISGPSGSGKTTLYRRLLQSERLRGKIVKSISVTTRRPREGEIKGRDYVFVSRKMFLYKKRAQHFLESQKVFDNYYGTPKKRVQELLNEGKDVLLCIDVKGARVVGRRYPKAVTVFITVPSLEILKKRLLQRGSESEQKMALRLKIAQKEIKEAKSYQHVIVNDNLTHAYDQLEKIITRHLAGK